MSENRFRWIAIAIGSLALIAAIAALVIANDASNEDNASKQDVTDEVSQLRAQLAAAGVQFKKGQADVEKKQQAALRKAAKGQAAKNQVTDARVDAIEKSISKLNAAQKNQAQEIGALQSSVKSLQDSVDKLTKNVQKLQNQI